eukprot:CAMPEP_0119313512 /NCGR_PEP_ID=MMETSP1333-20130426/29339_1 /TAXON_ID=418940 /ORGANISM="Scyphosphaera apsteinii, Strain RCC1455" /LENGTH=108 /DNA_ID=CAMNT_0007318363 /DNA_START=103 /DNA_END=426 /DNA_ORIENTATION=+
MSGSSNEKIVIPRNFKLLAELEDAEHGKTDMSVSMGLQDPSDILLKDWQCTILGPPNTGVENRIISLIVQCDEKYPQAPPSVTFVHKVALPFVDKKGKVHAKWLTTKW